MEHTCKGPIVRTLITPTDNLWTNPCPRLIDDGSTIQFTASSTELGKGSYGNVFEATCGADSSFAVKWISVPNIRSITNEIELQNMVAPYFAKPIYERWYCRIPYDPDGPQDPRDQQREKYGYVTYRLDKTLFADLFLLSPEQEQTAKQYYLDIFTMLYEKSIDFSKKTSRSLEPDLVQKMIHDSKDYTVRECQHLFSRLQYAFHLTFKIKIYPESGGDITIPILYLQDTMAQKRKKLFQLLCALNCLDGIRTKNILHNDSHSGNLMRKIGEDKYYAIDFGRSRVRNSKDKDQADLNMLIKSIKDDINDNTNRNHPVQLDVNYLVHFYPRLQLMVTSLYDSTPEQYRSYQSDFTALFDKEILHPTLQTELVKRNARKDMAEIEDLIQKTIFTSKKRSYGKKNKKARKFKSSKKNKIYII
jgi:serine/threonine protein kinase